jgi:hypothetical protein
MEAWAVTRWEKQAILPRTSDIILQICRENEVSADWLLGLPQYSELIVPKDVPAFATFYEKFKYLYEKKFYGSQKKFAEMLGIQDRTVRRYTNSEELEKLPRRLLFIVYASIARYRRIGC